MWIGSVELEVRILGCGVLIWGISVNWLDFGWIRGGGFAFSSNHEID